MGGRTSIGYGSGSQGVGASVVAGVWLVQLSCRGRKMNKALYLAMLKHHGNTTAGYSIGIVLYEFLVTWVYPMIAKSPLLTEIPKSFPSSVKSVFGVVSLDDSDTSYEAYISAQLFGRIWTLVMALYTINTATALLAELSEHGFLAYPLSAPLSRQKLLATQAQVLLTGVGAVTGSTIAGLCVAAKVFGIKIDPWLYLRTGLLGFCFFSTVAGYSMLFSALCDTKEQAMRRAGALTCGFYACDVLAELHENLAWVEVFTLFKFFRPELVLTGENSGTAESIILSVLTMALFSMSGAVFARKDLLV